MNESDVCVLRYTHHLLHVKPYLLHYDNQNNNGTF